MTACERDLLCALHDLNQAVQSLRTARDKPNLASLFARIEELAAKLPPETDPALHHYLNRKSYEKARLFLEGRDTENQAGACRH